MAGVARSAAVIQRRVAFRLAVAATPQEVRDATVRHANGAGGPPSPGVDLELLDAGPSRFAARYTRGGMSQLRVVEWSDQSARGAVELLGGGRLQVRTRFRLDVVARDGGSEVRAECVVETPLAGLGFALRFSGRRALARRLARAWLPAVDAAGWKSVRLESAGLPVEG